MKKRVEKKLEQLLGMEICVERPPAGYGDYASNIAFHLSKSANKSPEELARELQNKIDSDLFSKIEERQGFLNFFISEEALKEELIAILREKESYGKGGENKTMVIDYSSPNIAKAFGIGHLRSTVIGHALYNIFGFLGWKSIGINHLGDWGTQYGNLIYQLKKENKNPEDLSIKELEEAYVRFHKEAKENPAAKEEGRKWFLKLEQGDKETRRIWEACKEKSIREFEKIYQELEIEIDHCLPESFYEKMLPSVIEEAKNYKEVKESQGALIMDFPNLPPAMILKSDGSTTYFTRELAALRYRIKQFSPHLIIYEIGSEQTLHMRQLFAAADIMGWKKDIKLIHIAHGMFRFKEGRFSTREGRTIHLSDVLFRAKEEAKKIIEESKTARDFSPSAKEEIAQIIGIGAIKYNDLKRHHKRDVVFNWEEILALKGDTGPYLQYTCLRCKSILEKNKEYVLELENLNEEERRVVGALVRFRETVETAAESFSPNLIAEYAHELARDYNLLYDRHLVLGNNQRMAITEAVLIILEKALALLTISLPPRM